MAMERAPWKRDVRNDMLASSARAARGGAPLR
jgi:hypothetical protein